MRSPCVFGSPDHDRLKSLAHSSSSRAFLFTTPTVAELYGQQFISMFEHHFDDIQVEVLDLDEDRKSLETVTAILTILLHGSAARKDVVIAAGGGVLLDTVSLAATLFRRGLSTVMVPTTLTAQIDAAIGVKNAVNFNGHRNLVGTFRYPDYVLVDPTYLKSLNYEDLRQGLAEIVKVALILDGSLFSFLHEVSLVDEADRGLKLSQCSDTLQDIIQTTRKSLATDLFETSTLCRPLDFGHIISPELERKTNFSLRHGDAVALDIYFSSCLAYVSGVLDEEALGAIGSLLQALGLPCASPLIDHDLLEQAAKRVTATKGDVFRWPVPSGIGKLAALTEPTRKQCEDAIHHMNKAKKRAQYG